MSFNQFNQPAQNFQNQGFNQPAQNFQNQGFNQPAQNFQNQGFNQFNQPAQNFQNQGFNQFNQPAQNFQNQGFNQPAPAMPVQAPAMPVQAPVQTPRYTHSEHIKNFDSTGIIGSDMKELWMLLMLGAITKQNVHVNSPKGEGKTMLVKQFRRLLNFKTSGMVQLNNETRLSSLIGSVDFRQLKENGIKYHNWQNSVMRNQIVHLDEIDKATDETKESLLELLNEKTLSQNGVSESLPCEFFIATSNDSLDDDAFGDRFNVNLYMKPTKKSQADFWDSVLDLPQVSEFEYRIQEVHLEALRNEVKAMKARIRGEGREAFKTVHEEAGKILKSCGIVVSSRTMVVILELLLGWAVLHNLDMPNLSCLWSIQYAFNEESSI